MNELKIPMPLGPHTDSLSDARLSFESADRAAIVTYCPRNQCGAVLKCNAGTWQMFTPLRFDAFVEAVAEMEIPIPDRATLEAWADGVRLVLVELHPTANDRE